MFSETILRRERTWECEEQTREETASNDLQERTWQKETFPPRSTYQWNDDVVMWENMGVWGTNKTQQQWLTGEDMAEGNISTKVNVSVKQRCWDMREHRVWGTNKRRDSQQRLTGEDMAEGNISTTVNVSVKRRCDAREHGSVRNKQETAATTYKTAWCSIYALRCTVQTSTLQPATSNRRC